MYTLGDTYVQEKKVARRVVHEKTVTRPYRKKLARPYRQKVVTAVYTVKMLTRP